MIQLRAQGRAPCRRARSCARTAFVAAAHQYHCSSTARRSRPDLRTQYPDASYYETTDVTSPFASGGRKRDRSSALLVRGRAGVRASQSGLLVQIDVRAQERPAARSSRTDAHGPNIGPKWIARAARNDEGDSPSASTVGANSWAGRSRAFAPTMDFGGGHRSGGTRPFTHLVAQRTHIVERAVSRYQWRTLPSGAVIADYGTIIAARPSVTFADGVAAARSRCTRDSHSIRWQRVHDARTQATDMSFSYVERAGRRGSRRIPISASVFRVDRPARSSAPPQLVAYARMAAMPDEHRGDVHVVGTDARARCGRMLRHTALYVSQEQLSIRADVARRASSHRLVMTRSRRTAPARRTARCAAACANLVEHRCRRRERRRVLIGHRGMAGVRDELRGPELSPARLTSKYRKPR